MDETERKDGVPPAVAETPKVTLCALQTPRLSLTIEAYLDDDGLVLAEQDLGRAVEETWPSSEYECWLRVPTVGAEQLARHWGTDDLLTYLSLNVTGSTALTTVRETCRELGIDAEFSNRC